MLDKIPYIYGGRTVDGCDCWGLVRLCFPDNYLPSFDIYYQDKNNNHKSNNRLRILEFIESSGVEIVDNLTPNTICFGYDREIFGFGVWDGSNVLTTSVTTGSQYIAWDMFKSRYRRILLGRPTPMTAKI